MVHCASPARTGCRRIRLGAATPNRPLSQHPRLNALWTHANVGKHTLETLTTGMYSDPLDVVREYVQNACDAIDSASHEHLLGDDDGEVAIRIDPRGRSILVRDNGIGLSLADAAAALSDVGRSRKLGTRHRGFRGIGRLGGLGYCEELIFRTKTSGAQECYLQTWDARKLQELLSPSNHQDLDVVEVIQSVASDYTQEYRGGRREHFFEVRMNGVHEERLVECELLRAYLSETAPVPFDLQAFRFGEEIDQYLRRTVPDYTTYRVVVNDQVIYKHYRDTVPLSSGRDRTSGQHQRMTGVKYLTLLDSSDHPLAYCWLGSTELKGTIAPECGVAGVRLRQGNMLIGRGQSLERAFQKSNRRFSGFLTGEIHAVHRGLVPNARRDDFESNAAGLALYRAAAREICAPASLEIRRASSERSREKRVKLAQQVLVQAEKEARQGVVSEARRSEIAEQLESVAENLDRRDKRMTERKEQLETTAERVRTEAPHVVDSELQGIYDRRAREALKIACEMLYGDCEDKERAEALIRRIVKRLKTLGSRR